MQATFGVAPLSAARRNAIMESLALVALAFVYTLDLITPADLSVEVAYEVPVAIAGLTGSRKAFVRLSLIAAFLNVLGYLADGVLSTFDDPIGLENRLISIASLTLVCTLMIVVQRATAHNTTLAEQHKKLLVERELATEIERRHNELAARQEVIDELVEAIAHDVRTPLAALSLTLKQALRGQYGALPDEYREVARESRTSIDDISRLADSLLAVARFESGAVPAPLAALDLAHIAREITTEFLPIARAREIALECRIDADTLVAGREADLRRAMGNLLANAIRHTPPHGMVTMSACRSSIGWRLDVCDNGVGVTPAAVPALFERYAQGGGGTGLGLHIVRRIAESFGGGVAYEALPRGSRFSIDMRTWST